MGDTPYGYCECGCGQQTNLAPKTKRSRGWVKGQPLRFVNGHQRRKHWPGHEIDESGCWIWTGRIRPDGYGIFERDHKSTLAHRLYYELHVGPIPGGLGLDHLCRNTSCVNPEHLEPVTGIENTRRGIAPPAENARKTHCPVGHPLSGENLYVAPKTGYRACKACRTQRRREQTERQRNARCA